MGLVEPDAHPKKVSLILTRKRDYKGYLFILNQYIRIELWRVICIPNVMLQDSNVRKKKKLKYSITRNKHFILRIILIKKNT